MSLLRVEDLEVEYAGRRSWFGGEAPSVKAVNRVSFQLEAGETLGIVGESGCGKSSLAKTLIRLQRPTRGRIWFEGEDLDTLDSAGERRFRRAVQMVFQDPYGSLNPKLTVGASVAEGLEIHGLGDAATRRETVRELLQRVGLDASAADRYPHEFSGGQRQRIGIARALAVEPKLVICDEPVSALDVSVQAQVVNLLRELQEGSQLAYVFITHDLAVVEHVSHRLLVMYLGQVVEEGAASTVLQGPLHPYTQALLAAVPGTQRGGDVPLLSGDVPSPMDLPTGCPFHSRCPVVEARCRVERPELRSFAGQRRVACHRVAEGA